MISLLAEHRGVDPATISPSDRLREYAELDSLEFVELIMKIEDNMSVDVSDDAAANIETVQDLIDHVRKGKQ